jgi:hypothetical protein
MIMFIFLCTGDASEKASNYRILSPLLKNLLYNFAGLIDTIFLTIY